jgi:spore coat protein U-like protein
MKQHCKSPARVTALTAGLLMALCSPAAWAQLCTTSVVAPLFGPYRGAGNGNSANGAVNVSCVVSGGVPQSVFYTVKLDLSANAQGTQRRMAHGSNTLQYNVFCSGSYSQVWADGNSSTCTTSGGQPNLLGTLLGSHPVYGRIPGGQFVAPGIYTDSIAIQVLY